MWFAKDRHFLHDQLNRTYLWQENGALDVIPILSC